MSKPRIVLAFGTFDIIHPGHLSYLRQARSLGDRLVVVVSRDKTVLKMKKRTPAFHERDRLLLVQSLAYVWSAVLGSASDHLTIVQKIRPQMVCLGYDQRVMVSDLKQMLKKIDLNNIKIVRAKPYRQKTYKSSLYRRQEP